MVGEGRERRAGADPGGLVGRCGALKIFSKRDGNYWKDVSRETPRFNVHADKNTVAPVWGTLGWGGEGGGRV